MRKRLLDLVFSSLTLAFFLPLMVFIGIAIKSVSSGPVFSKEKKVGKNGKSFLLYHFRNPFAPSQNKMKGTTKPEEPFGQKSPLTFNWFFRLKLDQLPVLVNILKGEMSLVGPQPEPPEYVKKYPSEFNTILQVKPGIVNFSSVISKEKTQPTSKNRAPAYYMCPSMPQKIKTAKGYAQSASFCLDLKILFTAVSTIFVQTLSAFLSKSGTSKKNTRDFIYDARAGIIFTAHFTAALLCYYFSFWLRFDGEIPASDHTLFLKSTPVVLGVQMVFFYLFDAGKGLWRYTGLRDFMNIALTIASSSLVIWGLIDLWGLEDYSRSILIMDAMLLLFVLSGLRSSKRVYRILTQTDVGGNRVLIIGAGNAGEMIVRDMKQDRRHHCLPVGFIDDDPKKRNKVIHNIPVLGNTNEIEQIVQKVSPHEILIAIPSGTPEVIKKITQKSKFLNLPIKTLPNLSAILEGKASPTDIRTLDIEDLLGRAEIKINDPKIAAAIRGKRVLITGAGGSIGSELCRQVAAFSPENLILVERHENNLYNIELDLKNRFPDLSLNLFMADILDSEKMNKIFSKTTPQMVFHAAAYKHVPMMERNPLEAIRNNIIGTYRLLMASDKFGVSEFVLISTDKAVSPSSIMGATKRVAEMMVKYFDAQSKTKLVSVRFGNVLESAGSVVPIFRQQIKNGGPVRVTHPEVKRYFISIQEAVQLVLQASILGKGGEVFVLDMGKEIKVIDLAKTMIILSGFSPGEEIPIEIIGLRPGEKLSEGLFEDGEEVIQTRHKKIRRAQNKELLNDLPQFIKHFEKMNNQTDISEIKAVLKTLIPTFQQGETATPVLKIQSQTVKKEEKPMIIPALKP